MNYRFNKIDVIETINGTWHIFKNNLGMAIVGWLLAGVANFVISMAAWLFGTFVEYFFMFLIMMPLAMFADKGEGSTGAAEGIMMVGMMVVLVGVRIILQLIQVALSMFVTAGLLSFYIRFIKLEKDPALKTLLVFDRRVWYLFLFQFLLGIFIFLIVVICLIPGGICLGFALADKISFIPAIVTGSLGLIFLIIIVVYLQLVFSQAPYFIIDKRVGPIDAATLSYSAMKGNKFSVFSIWFLMSMVGGGIILGTCFLGIILVAPFYLLLNAKVYVNMVGEDFIPEQLEIEIEKGYI